MKHLPADGIRGPHCSLPVQLQERLARVPSPATTSPLSASLPSLFYASQVTLAAIMVTHVPLGGGATEGSLGLVQNIGLSHDRGWKDR